jgi:transposase-like protein
LNWKNPKWVQKYRCKKCNYSFINKKRKTPIIKTDKIFNERLKEWYSSRQLWLQKSKDPIDVLNNIRDHLDNNLIYQIDIVFDDVKHVMIDGTWISRYICLIIYYDYVNKKVIRFWFYDAERYEYIKNDLITLRNEFKYQVECFVVDWGKAIKKAIEKVFPDAKIQRCLTHIKRWGELRSKREWPGLHTRNTISKKPQSNCWKELKRLITFKNFKNEKLFIKKFNLWEEKYSDFLNERTSNWNNSRYTHKKLRSAKSHIKNSIPHMFYYLKDENTKKSNNDLEWLNWVLDGQIFNHRWLRKDRLISFVSLWIYSRNL